MAVRIAAAVPDRIAAAASFHGGRLVMDDADSPHLLLPKITARLYFGHAVEDQSMTADQIATLEAALRDWHGAFESEKTMKAPNMAGRCPDGPFTTNCRRSGRSRSWSSFCGREPGIVSRNKRTQGDCFFSSPAHIGDGAAA